MQDTPQETPALSAVMEEIQFFRKQFGQEYKDKFKQFEELTDMEFREAVYMNWSQVTSRVLDVHERLLGIEHLLHRVLKLETPDAPSKTN